MKCSFPLSCCLDDVVTGWVGVEGYQSLFLVLFISPFLVLVETKSLSSELFLTVTIGLNVERSWKILVSEVFLVELYCDVVDILSNWCSLLVIGKFLAVLEVLKVALLLRSLYSTSGEIDEEVLKVLTLVLRSLCSTSDEEVLNVTLRFK